MNLTATTHSLEVATATTATLDVVTSWTDIDKSGASTVTTPGSNQAQVSSATTTTVVAAPGATVYRVITHVSLRNAHASSMQTVTVKKDVGGTEYTILIATLYAGESLIYDGKRWTHFDSNGLPKLNALQAGAKSAVMMRVGFSTANLTSARTITSTNTMAVYVGKAPRSLTTVQVRLRVTTAAATITWAEVALGKGTPNVGANPAITPVGYADVAAVVNSTGQKTVTVNVSAGQAVNEGDDLWVLVGNQATTALAVRAQSTADDLQVGVQAAVATRPSLNIGTGVTFTIDGATTLAPWVALVV